MNTHPLKVGNGGQLVDDVGQKSVVQGERIASTEDDLVNRRLPANPPQQPPPMFSIREGRRTTKMPPKAEAAMDGAALTCYDEKPAWILPKDPWPSGGFCIADRISAEPRLGVYFGGLGEYLKEERVLRITRLDPVQIGLRQPEREGVARLLAECRQAAGQPDEPAEVVEIGHCVGHHRVPVGTGGRGGRHARSVVLESYDCHRQSIVTEAFFVRKQQQDRERAFVQHK
jgi:hypothetical protein